MTWKGEEQPVIEEPPGAIQLEETTSRGSKGEKVWPSEDLKEGQIGSNEEMLGRVDGAFQAEKFWFFSQDIGSHKGFLEF